MPRLSMFSKITEDHGESEDAGKNGGFQMILSACESDYQSTRRVYPLSISFFLFVFFCCSFIRNTWSIQRIASNDSISHDVSKIVLIQQSHIGTKKTYEFTEPRLRLLKLPPEELEV